MKSLVTKAEQGYEFYRQRRIPEAVEQFRLGLQHGEDPEPAALERWLSFMCAGEFELAWRESDRVLLCRQETGDACSHLPEHQRWLWDGTPLENRRVRVRCFHGLGDTIQFARFLPRLREVCREVQFYPQPELRELLPPNPGDNPELEIELMEVPHALRITLATIPAIVPYLEGPPPAKRESAKFRVGLAWASGAWRPERSVPLEMFRFFDSMPSIELVGLQRGPATLHLPPDGPVFQEMDWRNTSIAETARTIRGLDLVITTDTMVAHLAGALGVRVWTLLHWDSDWRWMADRNDSPWYPTMRLFRQSEPDNWEQVTCDVQTALADQQNNVHQNQTRTSQNAKGAHTP